jgi:hypothetical protein
VASRGLPSPYMGIRSERSMNDPRPFAEGIEAWIDSLIAFGSIGLVGMLLFVIALLCAFAIASDPRKGR